MRLKVKFDRLDQALKTKLCEHNQRFSADFGELQIITRPIGGELYTGECTVTPGINPCVIPTKNKVMPDDLTVKAIPFFETSNNSGGITVYIAKEL